MKHILVVDDDTSARMILKKMLSDFADEWVVLEADTGMKALHFCQTMTIDCLFLDLHLPDIDGFSLLKILTAKKETSTAIIMITGDDSLEKGAQAIKVGAQDYLVKGCFDRNLLTRTVHHAMEKHQIIEKYKMQRMELKKLKTDYEKLQDDYERIQTVFSLPSITTSSPNTRLNILLVDDDPEDRFIFSEMLAKTEFPAEIFEASCIEDGIGLLAQHTLHCVFVDHFLPDGTSLDFLRLLRDENHNQIPVIVMSGQGNEGIAAEAIKNGADDYLIKGHLDGDLLETSLTNSLVLIQHRQERHKVYQDLEERHRLLELEIEQRKRAESSLRLFRALADDADDFVFIVSPKSGEIVYVNNAVEVHLLPQNEGTKFWDFDQDLDKAGWLDWIRSLQDKERLMLCRNIMGQKGQIPVEMFLRSFGNEEEVLLMIVARDITHRVELEKELRHLTLTDGLTGLYNRRWLHNQGEQFWNLHLREQKTISLLMMDVDFFKKYNDTYGHQAGDRCLQQIAATIRKGLQRKTDAVVRYGGEEFVVVLLATERPGAEQVARQILEEVKNLGIAHESSPMGVVSLSIGVSATCPQEGQQLADLLEFADQALYQAKETGRNRIVFLSFDPP